MTKKTAYHTTRWAV